MCWINWITFSDKSLINKMNEKINHRWPDARWIFFNEKISFWQVRLSIIDLSSAWRQPMFYSKNIGAFYWDEDKWYIDLNNNIVKVELLNNYFSIVFNWEIYNYEEIKKDLLEKWYIFTTHWDTEVILAWFQEYWNKIHDLLNWMWAFCISDFQKNELIFSRDRFWIKPLYYFIDDSKNIIFSSEIKAILEYSWYQKEINEDMIISYLVYNKDFHLSNTFFKNIFKLENAHYAVFNLESKDFLKYRYWDLKILENSLKNTTFEERKIKIKEAFLNSIKLHNISDVEVWSCLSWWIDSSSVVCWVNELSKWQKNIKTFSAVFVWDKVDESKYIDIVNKNVNSTSYKVSPTWDELLKDLKDLIYIQEEPFNSTSIYNQYRVMKLVNNSWIKVTLDGQWWDEIFWWYNTFYSFYILHYLKRFQFIKLFNLLIWMKKYYSPSIFKSILLPLMYVVYIVIPDFLKINLSKKRFWLLNKDYLKYNKIDKNKVWLSLYKWYYFEQLELIQSLLRYADKNSMRWGVESRVPFLEKWLVELSAILPFEDKINKGLPKHILRESMKNILPEEIKNRYDKMWFETPEDKWLKSESMKKYMLELFNEKNLFVSKYIDINKFNILLNDFLNNKNNKWREVWKILNLELWGREYFR